MAERPAKRSKTEAATIEELVVAIRSVSDRELVAIKRALGIAERSDITELRQLSAARHAFFETVKTTLDVPTISGGNWVWELCQPNLLLSELVRQSAWLQAVFRSALAASPCSPDRPWSLVIAFDEFVPGNKLQLQPSRKSMNLSFTFAELGFRNVAKK